MEVGTKSLTTRIHQRNINCDVVEVMSSRSPTASTPPSSHSELRPVKLHRRYSRLHPKQSGRCQSDANGPDHPSGVPSSRETWNAQRRFSRIQPPLVESVLGEREGFHLKEDVHNHRLELPAVVITVIAIHRGQLKAMIDPRDRSNPCSSYPSIPSAFLPLQRNGGLESQSSEDQPIPVGVLQCFKH